MTFKVFGGRMRKDVQKLKKCRITCMSTGEVYGKIENYGCVWNATGGHQDGPFGAGVTKTKGGY